MAKILRKRWQVATLAAAVSIAGSAAGQTDKFVNPFNPAAPELSRTRKAFYSEDQGSRLMPAAWFRNLRQPNGQLFTADKLARFGYLPSPFSDLPIGFTESKLSTREPISHVGMTCAACHTRRITVGTQAYIVEGGPAFADLQKFMLELDAAAADAAKPANFDAFAASVLGPNPTEASKAALLKELTDWANRNSKLTSEAFRGVNWGAGRADAIQMIFNRVTGLDIGDSPDGIILGNIRVADAPARYPFLWNAHKGELTQWMAFAPNGNSVAAYLRNLGQCLGVFAKFRPRRNGDGSVDYSESSIRSVGLTKLENHMTKLKRPEWPFERDHAAELRGRAVWRQHCASCHEPPAASSKPHDVGTDTRQLALHARPAKSGVLRGQSIPGLPAPLGADDTAMNILKVAVVRTAITPDFRFKAQGGDRARSRFSSPFLDAGFVRQQVERMSKVPALGYEARKLEGVWAAAPYLHNGSVPTLADLLKPASQRPQEFYVGPAYDLAKVGLAEDQPAGSWKMRTTGCEDLHSGNSRCGHEYGTTTLSSGQKQDLLEFLKAY